MQDQNDAKISFVTDQADNKCMDEVSFVHNHPGFREGVKKNVPWKLVGVIALVATVSMALITILVHDSDDLSCLVGDKTADPPEADGNKTQMIIVANLLVVFVSLVLSGAPVEVTLLTLSAVAVLAGALDPKKLYEGTASNAVVLLALLFPIMKAMSETGYPDMFIAKFMGNPKQMNSAMFRMFIAVAILSGIFNNTPIVVMMIPVLTTYCQRLNFDHKAMLMPLSYASQAGGNLTLLGTSINLVAQAVFHGHGFEIGFFTLTVGAVFVCILDAVYCTFLGPMLLARKGFGQEESSPGPQVTMQQAQRDLGKRNLFNVAVMVSETSPLIGCRVKDAGLHRIKGVHILHRILRTSSEQVRNGLEMPDAPVSTVNLRESMTSWKNHPQAPLRNGPEGAQQSAGENSGYRECAQGWSIVQTEVFEPCDVLQIAATAEGVARLREVAGIELANESTELSLLGAKRRQRCLVEATVGDALLDKPIDVQWLKKELNCALIGIRRDDQPTLCRVTYHGFELVRGDVLLMESFKSNIGSDVWLENFGIVRAVPNSAPPRNGRKNDTLRALVTVCGLIIMVGLGTLQKERLSLTTNATILAALLILIKGITVSEAYAEINAPVLFTIVGALALGSAMQQTRLANCIAQMIVSVTSPFGNIGIYFGMYFATVGLGQFLNSQGNVALMGTIAIPLAKAQGVPVGCLGMVVVYAASACYMAPYGYQTNLLVMKPGDYTWGDYIKFGGGLQFLHMLLIVTMVPYFYHWSV